jgi:uncharacterized protein with PIN domain
MYNQMIEDALSGAYEWKLQISRMQLRTDTFALLIMQMMKRTKPFDKCPVCGGVLEEKEAEKLLRGGVNTAIVRAEVCLLCIPFLLPR